MSYPRFADWADNWFFEIAAEAPRGISIAALPSGPRQRVITFPELDRLWKRRDTELLRYYAAILEECRDADVFFSYGVGIHPDFLKYLPTFNAYFFTDDPEDSPWQSAKVAPAYDAALYPNIASSFQYESWGCQRHSFLPNFTAPSDIPNRNEFDKVFNSYRSESVIFVGGLDDYSSYRRHRLERFSAAFADGIFRGRGWPSGGIDGPLTPFFLKSRIGFNIHRTTGPINRRMFQLPAHGVMQICDNKTGLGQIFELGKEVQGFDTIDEAIELTKYYLEHENERKSIARSGYERFWKEYHAQANLARLRDQLLEWGVKPGERKSGVKQKLPSRNVSYFFGVARKTLQTEAQRLVRSAKAAKREYLRKDPWWKIYERVFTSESVYLPEYSECGDGRSRSVVEDTSRRIANGTQRVAGGAEEKEHVPLAGETPALHSEAPALHKKASTTPQDGALRWAMTQLIGGATRIGIFDPRGEELERYASVDAKRRIVRISAPLNFSEPQLDLLLCVPDSTGSHAMASHLRAFSKIAPSAVFGFPIKDKKAEEQNLTPPELNADAVFWMLKTLYEEVAIFEMPDPVVPWLEPRKFDRISKSIVAHVIRPI